MVFAPERQLVLEDEEEDEDFLSKMQVPLKDENRCVHSRCEDRPCTEEECSLLPSLGESVESV